MVKGARTAGDLCCELVLAYRRLTALISAPGIWRQRLSSPSFQRRNGYDGPSIRLLRSPLDSYKGSRRFDLIELLFEHCDAGEVHQYIAFARPVTPVGETDVLLRKV